MPPRPPIEAPALAERLCPLCGRPNDCQPAATGSHATPCWCQSVAMAPERLAAIPEAKRRVACLCRQCAIAAETSAP